MCCWSWRPREITSTTAKKGLESLDEVSTGSEASTSGGYYLLLFIASFWVTRTSEPCKNEYTKSVFWVLASKR